MGGVQRYFAEGIREEYASGGLDAQVKRTISPPLESNRLYSKRILIRFEEIVLKGRGKFAGDEGIVDCWIERLI